MISLKKILKEATTPYDRNSSILQRSGGNLFAAGVEPPMWKVVISDESGFTDTSKRNRFLLAIEKHINGKAIHGHFANVDIPKIMSGIKYYPATDKFVGVLPKFLFKPGNKPSMKTFKLAYEVGKISPTIDIREKK